MHVRVRIAPSPTGDGAHIGLARTALFNWLFARHHQGTFVFRSEDTDAQRSKPEYEAAIQQDFEWLGLNWDEFYRQSERALRHRDVAHQLLETGAAYECYCTSEELTAQQARARAEKRNYVYEGRCRLLAEHVAQGGAAAQAAQRQIDAWKAQGRQPMLRFKVQDYAWDEAQQHWIPLPKPAYREALEQDGAIVVRDLIKGDTRFELTNPIDAPAGAPISDLVVVRADGSPTYNFAVVVDDADMKISHVIRGDEHLNNTPKQMLVYAALGAAMPQFAHLPMILDKTKKKLSKRRSEMDVFVAGYRKKGFLPEALVNFLARLGWSCGDQEVFSLEDLIDVFSLDSVGLSPAVFDDEKLVWLNQHYIKTGDRSRLAELLRQQLVTDGVLEQIQAQALAQAHLKQAVELLGARVGSLGELAEAGRYLFREDFAFDSAAVEKHVTPETLALLEAYAAALAGAPNFSHDTLETLTQTFLETQEKKFKHLAQPLRLALSGCTRGAGLFEMLAFFEKDSALARIKRALNEWHASL